MIPMLAVVKVEADEARPIRLWIPLFVVWVLLAPFIMILAPLLIIGAVIVGLNPIQAIGATWGVFSSMTGTRIEIDGRDARVFVLIQ